MVAANTALEHLSKNHRMDMQTSSESLSVQYRRVGTELQRPESRPCCDIFVISLAIAKDSFGVVLMLMLVLASASY